MVIKLYEKKVLQGRRNPCLDQHFYDTNADARSVCGIWPSCINVVYQLQSDVK